MKDKDKSTSMPTLLSTDEGGSGAPQQSRAGGVGSATTTTTGTLPASADRTGNNGSYPGGSDSASTNSEGNQCNLNIQAIGE